MTEQKENQKSMHIRNLDPSIYQQARLAALRAMENIGVWVTEAIRQRLDREKGG